MGRERLASIIKYIDEFKTKSKWGFNKKEIDILIDRFPEINNKHFHDALMGNTCMMDQEEGLIMYPCDIQTAASCGFEKRDLRLGEWD